MNYRPRSLCRIASLCLALMVLPIASHAGEIVFVPALALVAEYTDNIDFTSDSDSARDDYSGSAIPRARLTYNTERFNLGVFGQLDFKKYLNETDRDRTNQLYQIETAFQANPRWNLFGEYSFRRDETTDSEFEETGRVFEREREQRHDAQAGLRYSLTELIDIGPFVRYRRRDFSRASSTDSDFYSVEFPLTKRFQNQRDTITLRPAYSHYVSDDNEEADDLRFIFGWERLISETLTFDIEIGPRYTRVEERDGERNSRWGGVGRIGLAKIGETFSGDIRYSHDIRSTTRGEIINVDRLFMSADKRITERFGARFNGRTWLSRRENDNAPNDKVFSFELIPVLYYTLTENHFIELSYSYRNQRDLDEPGNPVRQRNRVWLGLVLNFPQRWD